MSKKDNVGKFQIIRSMKDLEEALRRELVPISSTPPYFAESKEPKLIDIVTGAADTFWYDHIADSDNQWIGKTKAWKELYDTQEKASARVALELKELEHRFKEAGFPNFYYLPANIQGMINWIFINNAFCSGFDSHGEPLVYFGNMRNDNRKPEPSIVEFFLRGLGENIPNLLNNINVAHAEKLEYTMEGKGDQLPMSLPLFNGQEQSQTQFYHAVINCSGRRTHPKAIEEYAIKSGNYVIEIPLSSDNQKGAYHGNVAIFYYAKDDGTRGVVYVPDMLREDKRDFVKNMFSIFFGEDNVRPITDSDGGLYEEAIRNLTMNVISVGSGRIISSKNNPITNRFISEEIGLRILEVDMQAISLGGGGLQCCYTAINHNPLDIIRPAKYLL